MNKFSSKGAQGGFTLIELIVVIVILGILAATALPKFANLGGDARLAGLQAAKGAMSATASMVHGKYLINPAAYATSKAVVVEGTSVALNADGYPNATYAFADAAGVLSTDYKRLENGDGTLTITPLSVVGTDTATSCNLIYKPATKTTPAVYTFPTTVNCG